MQIMKMERMAKAAEKRKMIHLSMRRRWRACGRVLPLSAAAAPEVVWVEVVWQEREEFAKLAKRARLERYLRRIVMTLMLPIIRLLRTFLGMFD